MVTSGTAAPAGQTPKAADTTLGKQPGGTNAGVGAMAAGESPKKSSTHATAKKKKKKTTAKTKAKAKQAA